MKHCSSCNTTKSGDEFYRHPRTADGYLHICRDCHKERMRVLRLTNPTVQERENIRSKRPERKRLRVRLTKEWRSRHPEAYRAQTAVGNAVRDGKLKKQPCAICGTTKHIHAHHRDYSKALEVTWLCAKCHHRLHATFPELGGHASP